MLRLLAVSHFTMGSSVKICFVLKKNHHHLIYRSVLYINWLFGSLFAIVNGLVQWYLFNTFNEVGYKSSKIFTKVIIQSMD